MRRRMKRRRKRRVVVRRVMVSGEGVERGRVGVHWLGGRGKEKKEEEEEEEVEVELGDWGWGNVVRPRARRKRVVRWWWRDVGGIGFVGVEEAGVRESEVAGEGTGRGM